MLKHRSFTWFKYINPNIKNSGLFGHSKYLLLKKLPKNKTLKTTFIPQYSNKEFFIQKIKNLNYPLVLKPDNLYKGIGIQKIKNLDDINFIEKILLQDDYIVQEFSKKEKEYSVFYIHYPNKEKGKIISLVEKEFISFKGDGVSTLKEIIKKHHQGKYFIKKFKKYYGLSINNIPKKNEVIKSNFIGSHNRGVIFWNKSYLINSKIDYVFNNLIKKIDSFYYGRYDIKADSFKDIENGNFDVLELNGALAEPVHIYEPKTSIKDGYNILFKFWNIMFDISQINIKKNEIKKKS